MSDDISPQLYLYLAGTAIMTYFGAVDCVAGRIVEVVGILRNSETFREYN